MRLFESKKLVRLKEAEETIDAGEDNLRTLVNMEIKRLGNNADLNHIDVSKITHFGYVFQGSAFNGDISKWDTSKAVDMERMFNRSAFNGDISKWNTGKVRNMLGMFSESKFNGDISKWDTSKVTNMSFMFSGSIFNKDISKWNTSRVAKMRDMFRKSKFNGDISKWDTSKVTEMSGIFEGSAFNKDISKWNVSKVTYYGWYGITTNSAYKGKLPHFKGFKMEDAEAARKLILDEVGRTNVGEFFFGDDAMDKARHFDKLWTKGYEEHYGLPYLADETGLNSLQALKDYIKEY